MIVSTQKNVIIYVHLETKWKARIILNLTRLDANARRVFYPNAHVNYVFNKLRE